ncbi:MAG: flavodoxin [Marinilabiliaceae bacterium]|jgi:flavodoxin I|nr:flavodoxin [Marinilabiliaceae bacterium]
MKQVGIFYGPAGGSTEAVANKIAALIGADKCVTKAVSMASVDDLAEFENIIFGIATIGNETWNSEPLKSGWFSFMNDLEKADLSGKTIALYGLGDHIRYADHFVDAMGELKKVLAGKNVKLIGQVDAADYTFRDSKALEGDKFVGLPIDQDFEESLTDQRISSWIKELKKEFV